jgi:UDP-glucose-4-epimerase GalE
VVLNERHPGVGLHFVGRVLAVPILAGYTINMFGFEFATGTRCRTMGRILITGGAGYIGSHCAKALAAAGHELIIFDSLLFGHRDFVRWGKLIEGDIRDATAVCSLMATFPIDAVMHFAALAYVGESIAAPGRYYDTNVHGTRTLLDAMVRVGVRVLVFSSSCAIYGEPDQTPVMESAPLNPINPYGFTRLVCERMIDDFGRAHGLKSVRLRYFNAAGADSAGEIGEDHDPETHLIPLILDVASGRSPAVHVFGTDYCTPDGTAIRDYVHVTDLARAHVLALQHLLDGGDSFAVNLATGRGISVKEILDKARAVTGARIDAINARRRPGDAPILVADASRARELLGWSAERSDLATMLEDAWRWHKHRFSNQSADSHVVRA